ncbi:MAG: Ig domain-containing protein, partial [Planctomycetota bacterium]
MGRLVCLAGLLAAACGGGGGGAAPAAQGLSITTQSLPQGNVGHPLHVEFTASGGVEPYSWWISSSGGALPEGLSLTIDGHLAGTPAEPGAVDLLVVAQDSTQAFDLVSLHIEVRDVRILPDVGGPLVPGATMAFEAEGGRPDYRFEFVFRNTGGTLSADGLYVAGSDPGIDVVRAVDGDGFFDEIGVTVGDDPFVGFQPIWGTTDVWHVRWDEVYDPTPSYASDFDEVLATLGLRRPESTDVNGTEEDRLARLLVVRRTLGHLSSYFGNGMDGYPKPGGVSISFVGPAGLPDGTTPSVGGTMSPSADAYNSICVRYGSDAAVVGTAWYDVGNRVIEHDCGDADGIPLGVFANRILGPYLVSFANGLRADPVNA